MMSSFNGALLVRGQIQDYELEKLRCGITMPSSTRHVRRRIGAADDATLSRCGFGASGPGDYGMRSCCTHAYLLPNVRPSAREAARGIL